MSHNRARIVSQTWSSNIVQTSRQHFTLRWQMGGNERPTLSSWSPGRSLNIGGLEFASVQLFGDQVKSRPQNICLKVFALHLTLNICLIYDQVMPLLIYIKKKKSILQKRYKNVHSNFIRNSLNVHHSKATHKL